MIARERVQAALSCTEPDRMPYCETGVDRAFASRLLGWGDSGAQTANLEQNVYTVQEAVEVADSLQLDNLCYVLRAPIYARKETGRDGRLFYGEGLIRDRTDLKEMKLPDPGDNALYAEAEKFVEGKGDRSLWLVTRLGIFPTMASMGLERFSLALFDDRQMVEDILDRYCNWFAEVAERVCRMGFDVLVTTDDIAFKTGPFFSPETFADIVLPRFKMAAAAISLPWIFHSDGDVTPFIEEFISLGVAGLHPNEEGAMDIRAVKQKFGDRLCLLGNVDLNLLGLSDPETVGLTVRELIRDVGPGGGYILTSGNSITGYLRAENVLAMRDAVHKYGQYPIRL